MGHVKNSLKHNASWDREKLELREERKGIWLAGSETVSEKNIWVDLWMMTLAKKLRSLRERSPKDREHNGKHRVSCDIQ